MSRSIAFKKLQRLVAGVCASCLSIAAQERPQPAEKAPSVDPPEKASSANVATSTESRTQGLIRAANLAARNRDYSTCAQILEQVVAIDPNYKNGWNYLGWTYNALGQYQKAEVVLRKAIAADPADPQAYNNLGQALANQKRYDEAIPQYLKQVEVRPNDQWAHANLGRVYILTNQYGKAISELQIASGITPDDASIPFNLGRAYANANEPEKAILAFEKSADLQPIPGRWNAVAYQMAVEKLDLSQAKKYAQLAIAATVQQMRDTSVEHVTKEDANLASRIASYWDTWGWIRFQEGDLREAERYVQSAWMIHSFSVICDHLGQIYERQGRRADAIHMYQMALASDSPVPEARDHLTALVDPKSKIDSLTEEGRKLLKESRTIAVKNSHQQEGFAEFWILLSPGPVVRGVKFVTGDEELKLFEKDLEGVSYPDSFAEATEIELLRRGRLSCTHTSPDCRLQMISSQSVSTDEVPSAAPSVAGDLGRIAVKGNVTAAKLLKKVQPIYPPEARQGKIEGLVRLHAIIAKDGSIKQLEVVSGPPDLLPAALEAVQQWVYEPTLLQGQPVEVDTIIDVVFQLSGRK